MTYKIRQVLYHEQLSAINDIKFTPREIDVIACILHNRGEKKIAFLLLISPRTVSTHVHNIMLKLGHSSREYLIDFIEKSGKLFFVKQYYLQILIQSSFCNYLIKVGKTINKQVVTCMIDCKQISAIGKNILDQLNEHLKLANVTLLDVNKAIEGSKNNFYILTHEPLVKKQNFKNTILLLFDESNDISNDQNVEYIDFSKEENYYFSVFELLMQIINEKSLNQILQEFKKEYQAIQNSYKGEVILAKHFFFPSLFKAKLISKNFIFLASCSICITIMIAYLLVSKILITNKVLSLDKIKSDLPLPHESILLNHYKTLDKIHQKLTGKDGIQSVVLVGIGGSGKTTLAHQYARKQDVTLIWEINSETKESLISSFEQLAYSLCKTEEEKQELAIIPQIKDTYEKERKLFLFLTKRIRNYPDWLIIYNNVETFQDIQKYFPYDAQVWGNGKVIITTQDSNIGYNSYISAENVIAVGELSQEEALELFNKITNYSHDNTEHLNSRIIDFLEKIPSFPLDISAAAYYIKEEKISYSEYLKYISETEEEFASIQEIILSDIGEYNKTRYDIITLSIKRIVEAQPNFQDLLLFISMINPQDIPKKLLVKYKDNIVASKFIHDLRKFSLIAEKQSVENQQESRFSIHRSTQTIALAYLIKLLRLEQNAQQLEDMSIVLENSMDHELKKHTKKTPMLMSHIETFLSHTKLINNITAANLKVKLGIYYFNVANYKRALKLLEEALTVYKEHYGADHIKTSWVSTRLASVYRNMGDYNKAKSLLENALIINQKNYGKHHIQTAWVSRYLASVYRNIGDYHKAKELLEGVSVVYEQTYGKDHIETARVVAYLGSSYKNIGDYCKAKQLLEQAFAIYKEYYGIDHTQTAWISVRLGNVYRGLGDYDAAKALFEQALTIYTKHYGKNCIETAWSLSHLGSIYINLGDNLKARDILNESLNIYNDYYEQNHVTIGWVFFHFGNVYLHLNDPDKSQKMLKQALTIYETNYGEYHIQTAGVLNSLGEVSMLNGDIEKAEHLFSKSLNIFRQNKHPESYNALENLSNLYLNKSKQEMNKGNIDNASDLKGQSANYLKQALEILTTYCPKDSLHIRRIRFKLKNLNV